MPDTVHWIFPEAAPAHERGAATSAGAAGPADSASAASAGAATPAGFASEGAAAQAAAKRSQRGVLRRTLAPQEIYAQAANIIKAGGLVAFPTETVYGLGADALNEQALQAVYAAKGRPADNPLIAHIAHLSQLSRLCKAVSPLARELMASFWPGPLTITLPAAPGVPRALTAGLPEVAVRMPRHPVALALIAAVDAPLAAPSANLSGRPSPTSADHVLADLAGKIDGVIDGGPCAVGIESTVIALDPAGAIVILRPGAVGQAELSRFGAPVLYDSALFATDSAAPRAPGQKYRHYAPRAPVLLIRGPVQGAALARLERLTEETAATGAAVAALTVSAKRAPAGARLWLPLSVSGAPDEVARQLYGALRACDEAGVDRILLEGVSGGEMAVAVMNRMIKAAGSHIVEA